MLNPIAYWWDRTDLASPVDDLDKKKKVLLVLQEHLLLLAASEAETLYLGWVPEAQGFLGPLPWFVELPLFPLSLAGLLPWSGLSLSGFLLSGLVG
jgi:hypothetical protein